jgi:peptidylprolyl isomerase
MEKPTAFDIQLMEFCRKGFVRITADGCVLKKVIKSSPKKQRACPVDGCPTSVQYVGRLVSDGSIYETTRDVVDGKNVGGTDDPHEFQLFRDKWIKGMDIGISTMAIGEIARFVMTPEYAYGKIGYPPKVEPDVMVDIEVELLSFKDALPKFPSKEELAVSRKAREKEEREMFEANPPPSTSEKIVSSEKEKEKANDLFREGKYEEARKQYDTAFVHVFITKEEWEGFMPEDEKNAITMHKGALHLNRGMCKLKLGKLDDALWDCDEGLKSVSGTEPDPGNSSSSSSNSSSSSSSSSSSYS